MSESPRTAEDLINLLRERSPAHLDLMTAEDEDEFEQAFDILLERAVEHLETNSKNFGSLDEEGLTGVLTGALTVPGLSLTQEGNSNGHVDITIEVTNCSPTRKKLGEAKIYRGPVYHVDGLEQLLGRYTTGREGRGLLLAYVKAKGISDKMQGIRQHMNRKLPLNQKGAATDHQLLRWSFATIHEHESGDDCCVDHIGFNLYTSS